MTVTDLKQPLSIWSFLVRLGHFRWHHFARSFFGKFRLLDLFYNDLRLFNFFLHFFKNLQIVLLTPLDSN